MIVPQHDPVDLLILGAGWTSTFLIPLVDKEKITYAATTTSGRDGTIPFKYDPESDDRTPFQRLPSASTVLITFPLKGQGPSKHLTSLYNSTHPSSNSSTAPHFIQLGATSIWKAEGWQSDTSPYDESNERAIAEDELISSVAGCSLNLAGLYGGQRQPRNWVGRVINSKADLKTKGALHLIHGADVARAIVALHHNWTPGKRWLLCDLHVYDWWDLVTDWATYAIAEAEAKAGGGGVADATVVEGEDGEIARQRQYRAWVGELMHEEGVQALPRDSHLLGRRLDGRAFWTHMGIWPSQGRVR